MSITDEQINDFHNIFRGLQQVQKHGKHNQKDHAGKGRGGG